MPLVALTILANFTLPLGPTTKYTLTSPSIPPWIACIGHCGWTLTIGISADEVPCKSFILPRNAPLKSTGTEKFGNSISKFGLISLVSCCKSISGGGGGLFSGLGLSGIFLSLSNRESLKKYERDSLSLGKKKEIDGERIISKKEKSC